MQTPREQLEGAVRAGLVRLLGPEGAAVDPLVRPTQDARFGDYQSNAALGLAKRLGRPPRQVAEELAAALDIEALSEPAEISGPGFLNFRLLPGFLARELATIQSDSRLGLPLPAAPERIVVDYSSPNVAKEMHVGHLRSTIIGDVYARVFRFLGHPVLALNHIGDWGTQFGMLIQHLRESEPAAAAQPEAFRLDDLEAFYRAAKLRFDAEPDFADRARRAVVDLQSGDASALALWQALCDESMRHAEEVYERLGIQDLVTRGESFYNPMLPQVVDDLTARGIAVEDQGALCVFLDGRQVPLMIRKSGGGFGYDATDLAGVKHRVAVEHAQRIVYVTDIRQRQHFELVFEGARKAGYAPDSVALEHAGFGMVTGADRKPFQSRSGGTIKLASLLDEAEARARAATAADEGRRGEMSEADRDRIARVVGIGAVKYADLSHNIASDYVFDWDTMLALEGNTAPYMLYAYARIRSIGRRARVDLDALPADLRIELTHPSEVALAKELLRFPGVVRQVAAELRPHHLTDYLYSLSRAFSTFYDREHGVRVVDAEPESTRLSRLRLCDLTARALKLGLSFLGIEVVEQM